MGAHDVEPHLDLPPSLTNLGIMPQAEFLDTVSRSLVLVGVGLPVT